MLRALLGYLKRVAAPTQSKARKGETQRRRALLGVELLEDRVNPSQFSLIAPTLAHEIAGQSYSAAFHATGGDGNFQFAQTAGTLPAGLSLSSAGVLSGQATVAGSYTFTVTVTDPTMSGLSAAKTCSLRVVPGAVSTFIVSAPSTATAGASFTVTITPKDVYGNTVAGITSESLTASDGQTVRGMAPIAFTNGVATAKVALNTVDTLTLTATWGSIHGVGGSITVHAAAASKFVVSEPSTATAGASFTATITAKDAYGNTATTFSGTAALTSSDGQTVHLAATPIFANGVAMAAVTLNTAHTLTLTAKSGSIHGTGGNIAVHPAAASTFVVSEPSTATAGAHFTVTIKAKDAFGNTATGFSGTLALTASDGQSVYLAATPIFTNGAATATVTLDIAHAVTLTATSGNIHGTGGAIAVHSGAATMFLVSAPSSVTAGVSFHVTITPKDAYGNTVSGITNERLTASDGQTIHSAGPLTFSSGVATATIILNTPDTLTLTAASAAIHGTSGSVSVCTPGVASTFLVSAPSSATAGDSFLVTITAKDILGNTVTGFSGNVSLTSSDGQAVFLTGIPAFTNGVAFATVTLDTAHTLSLTATSGTIHGAGGSIAVSAGAASAFVVTEPGAATTGINFNVTITATDAFGNTVTSFSDSVALTSSDGQTVSVAGTPTFTNGVATVTVSLANPDTLTLTATSGTIQGTGGSIIVGSLANDWFGQNMPDVGLQDLARTEFAADGSLTYSDMLSLFTDAEADGTVTADELQSLQALVTTSGAAAVDMQASVQNLTYKVVNGDPANSVYQGASLGNLYAGSSATQLQELVAKWFLGEDHPTIDTYYISGWGTASYQLASGALFGSSGPSYQDIAQGEEGDCWLMSSFSVTAAHDPSIIQGMFTDDGTTMENGVAVHVWTVQFYHNGVTSYLTVDNNLPTIGGTFVYANLGQSATSSSNVLWVPLLEKAYAQLCASGWNQRPATNAYASLDGGTATTSLPIITGGTENAGNFLTNQSNFNAALAAGTLFTLASSYSGNSSLGIVPNHDYAVLGYDSTTGTYTLLNPWGWDYSGTYPGILNLTWAQITANFSHDGNCTP
jgi:Calpain family cysteine protease/Putative Ig domain